MSSKTISYFSAFLVFVGMLWYVWRFYPRQQMPVGIPVTVLTPQWDKYHNDCLHPCVRQVNDSLFVLVQSPYYSWDNKIENPFVYFSKNLRDWGEGTLLKDTPNSGYNSDPNVFVEDSLIYVFWRECNTPLCDSLDMAIVVTSVNNRGGEANYIYNASRVEDVTQCPIMMKHNDKYLFYAVWYQYEPIRKNKGIAIWEGTSLVSPDFVLSDTLSFDNPLVCDKFVQKRLGHRLLFLPKPNRYDLWHFDLFENGGKLYMVSCAEKDDNIMLSVSEDWRHFKTRIIPLINNHFSEKYTGYRQYYYKPTAIVQNDSLYLYYTANAKDDAKRNQLFLSVGPMKDLNL